MDTYEGKQETPASLHKFLYCQGNPIGHRDPRGRDMEELTVMDIDSSELGMQLPGVASALKSAASGGPDVTEAVDATLAVIFHGGVEQRSGERVRRLVNIEPNETATHRFFDDRL
jgi:hypothetical protein